MTRLSFGLRASAGLLSLALAVSGCGGDDSNDLPAGCDALVTAGADDQTAAQTALIEAAAGSTVCFEGTFHFTDELSLTVDGVRLLGTGDGATFDFAGQAAGGSGANGVHAMSVDGFTIENITVQDTSGDGIRVTNGTDVVFRRTRVIWTAEPSEENGAYGVYPVGCTNVLIEDSEVSGASDAGIYVGQSENIVVRRNHVHMNVAGIEIENSKNAEVYENDVHDNTGGVLVFDLPGLPAGNGGGVLVRDNMIYENNVRNFASAGTIVSFVPAGTGVMVLAADRVEVRDNVIRDHESTGMLIISFKSVEAVGAGSSADDPAYDAYPETLYVTGNTFTNNGTMPHDLTIEIGNPLEDILWDGVVDSAKNNTDGSLSICIQGTATFRNFNVLVPMFMFGTPSMDRAPHDCMHAPLPGVTLQL